MFVFVCKENYFLCLTLLLLCLLQSCQVLNGKTVLNSQ